MKIGMSDDPTGSIEAHRGQDGLSSRISLGSIIVQESDAGLPTNGRPRTVRRDRGARSMGMSPQKQPRFGSSLNLL
jgi:hypothetical protein